MAESKPVATARGRLPAELTSFVGRRRELADTRRLLSSSRLLTLTGAGGVGKTRLALRMAGEVRRTFSDGVWFAELAALRDPALLGHTLAGALELSQVSADPTADLAEYLEDKHLLLVMDNCEQLAEACAVLASKLLAAAPQLRILATSRHVLGVEGEQVLVVPPLSTPPAEALAADADQYESLVLFTDRVRALLPEFEIDERNRAQVIEICRQLDGVPLALELAAVWMRTLSPAQILDRLEDRFRLLASGRQAGPARQQALDAAVTWSYDLCSPAEQLLWERLSVFSGGFDLEGAEQVCAGDGIARDEVLDLVAGLLNKSIITRTVATDHSVAWYDMLTTISQYGAMRLAEAGRTSEFRLRHRDYYRDLAAGWAEDSFGPRQADWYIRMRREHDNLRAALDFCLAEPGEGPVAVEIAAPIWNFWFAGFLREGHRYLSRAIAAAPEQTPARALGLWAGSYLAMFLGEVDQGSRLLAECEELAERYDDARLRARIAEVAGHALIYQGDLAGAIGRLEEGLAGFRAVGDRLGEFDVLILLSAATFFAGDPRVEGFSRLAYELADSRGAASSKAYALWSVGIVQWRDHDQLSEATNSFREAIRLWQPLNDRTGIGFCVQALSWCAGSGAPTEQAARLMGASRAVWRSSGAHVDETTPYSQFDDRTEQRSRAAIGDAAFDAAFRVGAAYSFEQAVSLALGEETGRDRAAKRGMAGRLTRREHEIAVLIGEGLSNREIAARLVISQRTAETHVEHILSKLGFSSRAQVARWVAEHAER
ncbi:ATP-binding protein [Kribbella shirazensis]|uniref:Putative ATPase/DNA-binding CsgD family transcriptional regulator n=1 Tax=Kribbella shirazensis TaxID=1105143 RepID=A0A7X6A4L5_9ACTN|nr:LuxR C-terminal-related transcriptional regulator [Kribbella shirazensis]NIK60439.1 putative ATPase/DNA-binding CsgD family transcriptional regulator [Kribbella shirazensis]